MCGSTQNRFTGDIISQIQKTVLKMFIYFKISKQAMKNKNKAKYELSTFCKQYELGTFKKVLFLLYIMKQKIERLSLANGSQMNIKYKLLKVHICQYGVCFMTFFVLIRNMTDRIILELPFIYLLYSFTTTTKGLISQHLDQNVTFHFLTEPKEIYLKMIKDQLISKSLNLLQSKNNHLKFLKNELKYKKIEEQLIDTKL